MSAPSTLSPERSGTTSSAERPSASSSSKCSSSTAAARTAARLMLSIRTGSPVRITPATAPSSSRCDRVASAQAPRERDLVRLEVGERRQLERPVRPGQVDRAPVGERGDRQLGDLLQRGVEVERRAEQPAGLGQQPLAELRALDGGDVLGDVHRHHRTVAVVVQHRGLDQQPPLVARLAIDPAHEPRRRLALVLARARPGQVVRGERPPVGVVEREALPQLRHRRRDQLLDRAGLHQPRRGRVGHHDPAAAVDHA